jgi:hypothetical protein
MSNFPPLHDEGFCRIGDYAMIGDCRAAALISRDGSLDWLCWPRFDSPAIFSRIVDARQGGHWRIRPADPVRVTRAYVRDSNVLETAFECAGGSAVLTDLMPVASEETKRHSLLPDHEIIRQVECVSGEVQIEVDFHPRVGYGEHPALLRDCKKLGFRAEVGSGVYWLRSSQPTRASRIPGSELRTENTGLDHPVARALWRNIRRVLSSEMKAHFGSRSSCISTA